MAGTVGVKNPFRYRGYYLDAETGLYYVGSRYYDPVIRRFISLDTTEVLTAVPMALRDKNLYVYCNNNPIVYRDNTGTIAETALDIVSLCASVADVMLNPADPWAWAGLIGDTIDLLPFVTGVGEITKAASITVKAVDKSDDVINATRKLANAKDVKKFTGYYEITFESGNNYAGKGGMYRSTVSAKYRSAKNNDRVVSITWTPALTDEEAFIQEYILMKKRGVRNKNTYNRIWSPGRSMVITKWSR